MHGLGPVCTFPFHHPHRCHRALREEARLAALAGLFRGRGRGRVAVLPLDCRADLAAAQRTISRLRRGLLDTAERAALLKRLPRWVAVDACGAAAPRDRNAEPPGFRKPYAPDPPGTGLRLDITG